MKQIQNIWRRNMFQLAVRAPLNPHERIGVSLGDFNSTHPEIQFWQCSLLKGTKFDWILSHSEVFLTWKRLRSAKRKVKSSDQTANTTKNIWPVYTKKSWSMRSASEESLFCFQVTWTAKYRLLKSKRYFALQITDRHLIAKSGAPCSGQDFGINSGLNGQFVVF